MEGGMAIEFQRCIMIYPHYLVIVICRSFQAQPWPARQRRTGTAVVGAVTWHTSWSNGWRQLGRKACKAWGESWCHQQYNRWLVSLADALVLLVPMCLTNLYPVGKNCRPVTQPNQSYSETKFEYVTSAGRGFFWLPQIQNPAFFIHCNFLVL